jgi:hypothetical protein
MEKSLVRQRRGNTDSSLVIPSLVRAGGEKAARRFLEASCLERLAKIGLTALLHENWNSQDVTY